MPERTGRPQTRLEPSPAWTLLTDSPLKGLALAREAGTILVWDEGHRLYLFDTAGGQRAEGRAKGKVAAATISDDGSLIALLVEGSRLVWLDAALEPVVDRLAPPDANVLAADPHGRYLAVGSQMGVNYFYTRHGRPAGKFETRQPLAHLAFVPARPFLLGASSFGAIVGVDLRPGGSGDRLAADVAWQESVLSNVGRLTTTGDGGMILASCFIHGLQRYDLRGHNEGAYHPGGTVSHAVADFAGRLIAAATLEGELVVLSPGGHVRWRTGLSRPAVALECDPLGRFLVYGHPTGEVVRLDLEPPRGTAGAARRASSVAAAVPAAGATSARSIRKPDWVAPVASSDEQAETAVVAVLDAPPRVGVLTSAHRLQVFDGGGKNLGFVPEVLGIGRFLRTSKGWIAAATDRQVALYDARRNVASRIDLSLVEVTHLEIRPDGFGLAIVQERDRVGRATPAGRWIWKKELRSPVEDLAIGPDGHAALTTDAGRLEIYNPAGEPVGGYASDPSEPLCLIEAPDASPEPTVWVTLARRAQVLRGHDLRGRVLWQVPVAWEGWRLQRVGPIALVSAPDGRALAFDGAGRLHGEGRPSDGAGEIYGVDARGEPWRVLRQGVHLICADLAGDVRWRTVADEPLGPVAAGTSGVAALIGRSLAWFSAPAGD